MPFWGVGTGDDSSTEDLAAWLRDVSSDGVSNEPFDSSIDASWLGTAPASDEGERGAEGQLGAGA
jgi:hypothetical protein